MGHLRQNRIRQVMSNQVRVRQSNPRQSNSFNKRVGFKSNYFDPLT